MPQHPRATQQDVLDTLDHLLGNQSLTKEERRDAMITIAETALRMARGMLPGGWRDIPFATVAEMRHSRDNLQRRLTQLAEARCHG